MEVLNNAAKKYHKQFDDYIYERSGSQGGGESSEAGTRVEASLFEFEFLFLHYLTLKKRKKNVMNSRWNFYRLYAI